MIGWLRAVTESMEAVSGSLGAVIGAPRAEAVGLEVTGRRLTQLKPAMTIDCPCGFTCRERGGSKLEAPVIMAMDRCSEGCQKARLQVDAPKQDFSKLELPVV